MKRHYFAVALSLAAMALTAQAADPEYFKFRDILASPTVTAFSNPAVRIYLVNDAKPELAEQSRPDTYSGSGISLSPFGGSRRHCVEAYEKALKGMIDDAAAKGYDAILDLRAMGDVDPNPDPDGFSCQPAYKVTIVSLHARFGLTKEAAQRIAAEERRLINSPYRAPWEDSVYVPLEPIALSPEAQAALGPEIKAYWGIDTPAYTQRFGPDDYPGSSEIGNLGIPAACKIATLKALQAMAEHAREQKFDSIVKIRSRMYEQYTPGLSSVECEVGKREVFVNLQASLVNRQ